jgi:DNA-binding HxlR family transcriptional regulator
MDRSLDPHCQAFQVAIEVLCRPWTGLILTVLQDGPLRFSELEEGTRGVGAKTLSARLKELEAQFLVSRQVEVGPPIRVNYSLTSSGQAFGAVAEAIQRWGAVLVTHAQTGKAPAKGMRPRRGPH